MRPARPRDAVLLARWRLEPSIRRFQPLPAADEETMREDLARQHDGDLRARRGDKFQWIVEADGEPAGWITLAVISWDHGLAEIGYALSTRFQRLGVMSRALRQVLAELFTHTDLERIEARCATPNVASRRVLERAGFRCEGTLKAYFVLHGERVDNELYAVLKRDWT